MMAEDVAGCGSMVIGTVVLQLFRIYAVLQRLMFQRPRLLDANLFEYFLRFEEVRILSQRSLVFCADLWIDGPSVSAYPT